MTDLLQWWNLIFLLPLLCAGLYHLLLAVGAVAPGEEHELDAHAEADPGLEHDALHVPAAHGHAEQSDDVLHGLLGLLGIGKVPLSIIVVSWCYVWGVTGYLSNQALGRLLPGGLGVWPSLAIAAVSAVVLTRYLALGLARVLPKTESYGVYTGELVGRPAVVRHRITTTFGTAQLYDQYGTMHEVSCRTRPEQEPIPVGTTVALVEYDEARQVFLAVPI